MQQGVHFYDVFSPAPNLDVIRLLQVARLQLKTSARAWDLKCSFLNGKLPRHEWIYITPPKELAQTHPSGEAMVWVLHSNTYGIPTGSRNYTQDLKHWILQYFNKPGPRNDTNALGDHHYKPPEGSKLPRNMGDIFSVTSCDAEPCLYIFKHLKTGILTYVSAYVDDFLAVGPDEHTLLIKQGFESKYQLKEVSPDLMLGVQATWSADKKTLKLTMPGQVDELVKEFAEHIKTVRKVTAPMPPGTFLQRTGVKNDTKLKELLDRGILSLLGSLLWNSRNCFPGLSIGVSQLSSVISEPTEEAWNCAIHMLRYINQNRDVGISFHYTEKPNLAGYFDASNKHHRLDGKCQYGYVMTLCGGPISWASKKLGHVGISSSHNEYMGLAATCKKTRHLRALLAEMHLSHWCDGPTPLMGDNLNANKHAREPNLTSGNMFYDKELHFAKESFDRGHVCPRYVNTKDNLADPFTKCVTGPDHEHLVTRLCGNHVDGHPEPPPAPPNSFYHACGLDGAHALKTDQESEYYQTWAASTA